MLLENRMDTRNWGIEYIMCIYNVSLEAEEKKEYSSMESQFSTRCALQQLAQQPDMLLIAWAHFATQVFQRNRLLFHLS